MSSPVDASALLRVGLLEGVAVVVVGSGDRASVGAAVAAACRGLGASVGVCAPAPPAFEDVESSEAEVDAAVASALAQAGGAHALVVDGGALFAEPHAAGEPLRACMLGAWMAVRALAARALIGDGAGAGASPGGRIVLLAPPPDAGPHADAAAAGLENLARTLSIEWARHSVTAVALSPGAATAPGEVAAVTAYLLSPAGAYFSGCLLDMRAAR